MRTRDKLVNLILDHAPEGAGLSADDLRVQRNGGSTVYDPMPWQGTIYVNGHGFSIGSWSTMGDCVRRGITVEDARGKPRAEVDFYVWPVGA